MNTDTTKRYRLIKNFPDIKYGVIFTEDTLEGEIIYRYSNNGTNGWHERWFVEDTGYFEEVLPASEPVKERVEVKDISFQQEDNRGYFYYIVKTNYYINQKIPLMKAAIESALNDTVVEDKPETISTNNDDVACLSLNDLLSVWGGCDSGLGWETPIHKDSPMYKRFKEKVNQKLKQ